MTYKVILHPISIILAQGMQQHHWWWCWHHVMPMPTPMVSHDQKSHVAPHFCCLDLWNAMVLSRPLDADINAMESHDSNSSASGIMWYKCWGQCHCTTEIDIAPHFNCLNVRKAVAYFMILLSSCGTDASANGINNHKIMLHLTSIVLT